jgi:hypothetical protein
MMMTETAPENDAKGWKRFLRKHWNMLALFVVGAVLVSFGAVYVFLWFAADAQSIGLVPRTLGLWTMGSVVAFLLNVIFWELLLVGVPVIIVSVAGWLWWRRLPYEEKKDYHLFDTRSRSTSGGGGAVSLLFWIAFCIKVYVDGNWNVAVATWTLDYLVYSSVWTVIWILVIFGIPASVIGIIWWIIHERKRLP